MNALSEPPEYQLKIGRIRLDHNRRSAERDDEPVAVEPRVFDLLWYLGHHAGRICSKNELLDVIWQGRVVSESTLYRAVALARDLIGDELGPRIRTVHARGYELIGPVERIEHAPAASAQTANRSDRSVFGRRSIWALVLTLAILPALVWLGVHLTRSSPDAGLVAVEIGAFERQGPAADFPGEAFWQELRSELSRVNALRVVADGGRREDAGHRLQGHWRVDERELVTHAELRRVPSNRLSWSANFRQPIDAADQLRHAVATAIIEALALDSVNRAGESLPLPAGKARSGYSEYLKARGLWRSRSSGALLAARELLERVIIQRPDFARAHEALASVYVVLPDWLDVDAGQTRALAWASAREALRLEPRLGEARAVLAQQAIEQSRWVDAERLFLQAISREPGNATIHHWYAEFLLRVGRLDQARLHAEESVAIDAISGMPHAVAAWAALLQGRDDQAAQSATQAVELGLPGVAIVRAWAEARRGQNALAIASLAALPNATAALADCAAAIDDPAQAQAARASLISDDRSDELAAIYNLACLAMLGGPAPLDPFAIPPVQSSVFGLIWSREFAGLRRTQAFQAQAESSGLLAYWREFGPPDGCQLEASTIACGTARATAFQSDR